MKEKMQIGGRATGPSDHRSRADRQALWLKDAELNELLDRLHTAYPKCGFVSMAPAAKWDDGSVAGNGVQGVLAFCRTGREELVLSHEELFLPLFPFCGYLPVREHYNEVRRLVFEGKADEAQAILRRLKKEGGFPGYNTTNPFVGAGMLTLNTGRGESCDRYIRSVDFINGESLTAWETDGAIVHRRFFVSRADDLIAVKMDSPVGSPLTLSLKLGEIPREPVVIPNDRDLHPITIERCAGSVSETFLTHTMAFKERLKDQKIFGCSIAARVIQKGGSATVNGDALCISDAEELIVLIRIEPVRKRGGAEATLQKIKHALSAITPAYGNLLQSHAGLHGEMMTRCTLRLANSGVRGASSEALLAGSSVGRTDPALVEKVFSAGRHGIISSTGRMPPLLQGVWTGTWKPRWSGDYTLNGNVQSMAAGSLPGNHYECMESLLDYMDSLLQDFRDNARELLGFRGYLIPWRASTHGRTHYLAYRKYHHNFPGIYWFAGAAWFAQLYYDYYLYTSDEDFFENRLKPYLLESILFYEDYLTFERDGKYVLSPSSSPENETADDIWIAPNATMTIAAVKQLLRTLLRESGKLGVDGSRCDRWREMLTKMPDYQVGANGALKEWSWPGVENQEVHRHASHLYPLYYGVDPDIAGDASLKEACRIAIDRRMEFRRHDGGSDMAFGFVQLGLSAAHLGDTALAYETVEYLVNTYWSPAMVSQHNPHDVFNLDISGGLPAVIITMLLQSSPPEKPGDPWEIHLLPCLPGEWSEGALCGVRCRGGFELDIYWRAGDLEKVRIKSPHPRRCLVKYRERMEHLDFRKGESTVLGKV